MDRSFDVRITCSPGEVRAYRFSYESSGVARTSTLPGAADGPESKLEIALQGRWRETCVEQEREQLVLEVVLSELTGHVRGNLDGAPRDVSPLAGAAFATVASDGEIVEVRHLGDDEGMSAHVMRDLFALRSFRLTAPLRSGATWPSEERDLHGTYRSRYEVRAASAREVALSKMRDQYLADGAHRRKPDGNGPRLQPDSGVQLRLTSADGSLLALSASNGVEHWVAGQILGRVRTTLELERVDGPQDSGDADRAERVAALQRGLKAARRKAPDDLSGRLADERLERKLQLSELGGETWESLSSRLAYTDAHDSKLFLQLKALFLTSPERALQALTLLEAADDANHVTFQTLAGALAAAGTSTAQRSLREAAARAAGDAKKQQVLVGLLGAVHEPSVETESFLIDLSDGEEQNATLGEIAKLALGSVAANLSVSEPARSTRLVEYLADTVEQAESTSARAVAIAALGNSKEEAALGPLLDALDDGDPGVRATAARGLDGMDFARARTGLLARAHADSEPDVRIAATQALRAQRLGAEEIERLGAVARSDSSESVRVAAVVSISEHWRASPNVLELLAWLAQHDRSSAVRNTAKLILERVRLSG